jgi:hypothetical protein
MLPQPQPNPAVIRQPETHPQPVPPNPSDRSRGNTRGSEPAGPATPSASSHPEPKSETPPPPALPAPAPESFTISLPNGKDFDSHLFNVNVEAVHNTLQMQIYPRGQVVAIRPNNRYDAALAGVALGKLHGKALAFYSNQKVMTYLNYKDGYRDGIMKTWLNNGDRCFWAQYSSGSQNGFSCLFTDDAPCLLIESTLNKVNAVYLIRDLRVVKRFSSLDDALADPQSAQRVKTYKEVVSELAKNELEFREMIKKELARLRGRR